MRKRLCLPEEEDDTAMDKAIRDNDIFPKEYDSVRQNGMPSDSDEDDSDNEYILERKDIPPLAIKRDKMESQGLLEVEDKRMKGDIAL